MQFEVKDLSLASEGKLRIEWADRQMPVVASIRVRFARTRPLRGLRIAACLHVTSETANLARALQAGGAVVALCASNPLSTQDEVAASLVRHHRIGVFAVCGENRASYYRHINAALDLRPQITLDDGADLVSTLHSKRRAQMTELLGGTEETTTGVIRLRSLEKRGLLGYPIIAVNDAQTKHLFDNRYGTGQSTIDGIIRATNLLLAGRKVVVAGYGWCGRGVATRARGMGAQVVVTEVDPLRALEAVMDGYAVVPMAQAAAEGDVFITLTGDIAVITREHFLRMKDGAILANSGHFDVEIDIAALRKLAKKTRFVRSGIEEFTLRNGRRLYLLAQGRLVNLAAAEGHPATVMDMSFANQALSVAHLARRGKSLEKRVYSVPAEIDRQVAALKLAALAVGIDRLTPQQKTYLSSWEVGT
jgi:adenosylhomocysteinase